MVPEPRPLARIGPVLSIMTPGITLLPLIWCVAPELANAIGGAWLINLVVFMPPWLLLTRFPGLRSATVVLALSGFRLICLPLLLFALKNTAEELNPALLGWTLGLYVLNLISMTVMESRIRT